MKAVVALVLLQLIAHVAADCYMHNPRGSNDRLNEENTNRNNGNRMFDSQNNAKGGYCVGPAMSFYEGSQLTIMWTVQHGCGDNPKMYCNIVLQYMCSTKNADPTVLVRDGTTTDTIPDTDEGPTAVDANGELLYGMHEPRQWYRDCDERQRNMGLWISDREEEGGLNAGREDARFTRQNNNANRNGYECAEERDYYPYWVASPWRDIAILTDDESWCSFYKSESQNRKAKYVCLTTEGEQALENNEQACAVKGNVWTKQPSWGIGAPDCIKAPWSRENHLGNGVSTGNENTYNWTLPTSSDEDCISDDNCNCVVRIRYNISTGDLGKSGNRPDKGFIDWTSNAGASPVKEDSILNQDGLPHQLALDTSQFGRTFQDRSHVFHIKPRPSGVLGTNRIFNLNVRGKRGNIVQTYPATEYDFIPHNLDARQGDYIHFQWTGCDTNPAGNAGEGTAQTDRSNMVQVERLSASAPATDDWISRHTALFESQELRKRMAMLGQYEGGTCLDYEALLAKNNGDENAAEADVQNCMKLNAALQYFDGGLIKMNKTGTFYYMSTRNHNFSNRDQKGELNINPLLPTWAIALVSIGSGFFLLSAGVAGAMLYAKSHPHSGIATAFSKM